MWSSTNGCQSKKCELVSQNQNKSFSQDSEHEKNIAFAAGMLVGAGYTVEKNVEKDVQKCSNVNGLSPQPYYFSPYTASSSSLPNINEEQANTLKDYGLFFYNVSSSETIQFTIGKCPTVISVAPQSSRATIIKLDSSKTNIQLVFKVDTPNSRVNQIKLVPNFTNQTHFYMKYDASINYPLVKTTDVGFVTIVNENQPESNYLIDFFYYPSEQSKSVTFANNSLILERYDPMTNYLLVDLKSGQTSGFLKKIPSDTEDGFYTVQRKDNSISLELTVYHIDENSGFDLGDCSIY